MEKKLEVILLQRPENAEQIVAAAAKLCYSNVDIPTLLKKQTSKQARKFIDNLVSMGHESPLEHAQYTFGVHGISRACSHQLVRHRIASYSQQSQRYVGEESQKHKDDGVFDYIVPPSIVESGKKDEFVRMMKTIQGWYDKLVKLVPKEDARFVLPNAAETRIMFSMNARSLLNFFKERLCNRAQWEIRELANKMYDLVLEDAPSIFKYAGPNCVHGKCKQGDMSCGKIKEVREKFRIK